ncbi:MAG TPA: RHS repeat-associated core domain-containing protein, partial [Bryobacteraceae bacterium]|nr:RHS repeat-associated core domain-containing protein [Bryobacteraceae bacterium]
TDPSLLDLNIWQGEPAGGTLLVRGQVQFSGQSVTVTAWAAEEDYEGYTGGFRFVRTQLAGARYLLYDGGGHTRGLLDATGQPLTAEIYAYDAYGNRIEGPSVTATNLLYRGEYFDATLGQYVLRARYYDPASGRFFSEGFRM